MKNVFTTDENEMVSRAKYFSMKTVSAILDIKGFGRTKLYSMLRKLNYLNENNVAYECYVENGYFINKKTRRDLKGVHVFTNQVMVTIKGLELIKKLMKEV